MALIKSSEHTVKEADNESDQTQGWLYMLLVRGSIRTYTRGVLVTSHELVQANEGIANSSAYNNGYTGGSARPVYIAGGKGEGGKGVVTLTWEASQNGAILPSWTR